MKPDPRKQKILDEQEDAWTDEELRALASVRGSALQKPLSKALTMFRNAEHGPLLSADTPFDRTQYVRGRLSMLRDLVLLLEEDAPRAYDARKARKPSKDSPP